MKNAGIILLGGKARRLGGVNKAGLKIGSRTCFKRAHDIFLHNVDDIAVSISQEYLDIFPENIERIVDWPISEGQDGVALAIMTCLDWAQARGLDFIITTPVDTPFLPHDFSLRLIEDFISLKLKQPIVAQSASRMHGLHALWPVASLTRVKGLILEEGEYTLRRLHMKLESHICEFEVRAFDPFMNINTADDFKAAQRLAASLTG